MIIGNGLIATAFKKEDSYENAIIFASGVANSANPTDQDCLREENMIKSFIDLSEHRLFVYFSTCSIFDSSLKNSLYVKHKINMEYLIAKEFHNYLIIRLPILVGRTQNPHTLINYLASKIINYNELTIFTQAYRYLLDIDSVVFWTGILIKKGFRNTIINMAFDNKMKVTDIVLLLQKILGVSECKKIELDKGNCYDIDNSVFLSLIKNHDFTLDMEYNEKILRKYYAE